MGEKPSIKCQNKSNKEIDKNMETIITKYSGKLRIFAYKFVRDWDVVDDILQEVYIKVLLNINTLINKESIKSWLYTITFNQCLDYLRLKYVKNTILTSDFDFPSSHTVESAEIEIIQKYDKIILHRVITTLPKHYKEPLLLYYFYHFSYKEISTLLKISIQNIKTRIHRAKKMIKEKYLSVKDGSFTAF
jgi:RNA polymerase sigma-70 factor (ECF subfamily)